MESTNGTREPRAGEREDSWVDALVTLLAIVLFGLGWALVELERAEPAGNGYDAAERAMWVAVVDAYDPYEGAGEGRIGDERWTELALQRSTR